MTDPNLDEEKELSSSPSKGVDEFSMTIGYLPSLDQVAALLHEGTTSSETLVAEVRTSYVNFTASRCLSSIYYFIAHSHHKIRNLEMGRK